MLLTVERLIGAEARAATGAAAAGRANRRPSVAFEKLW
jgi:hypothetical protein